MAVAVVAMATAGAVVVVLAVVVGVARGLRVARVVHRHEPCDHDVVVEPAEGRQSEVLAGPGWGGYGLLVVEQASSSGVAATPPLMHIAPPLVGHFLMPALVVDDSAVLAGKLSRRGFALVVRNRGGFVRRLRLGGWLL